MIQDQLNQRIENTNSTNPEYFKKFETDPATIAIFNEVPLLGGRAAYSWGESLYSIAKTIQNDDNFTNYLEEHGGPLTGYAVSTDYMLIYVAPEKRNELTSEDIKIIMEIINQAAADHGVENVPVVFHASRIEISGLDYTLDS
ncbi:hypothetical protein [Methanimicrococcus blatticola]|nr:hypothetical protein [Methanimicrococcus blatticola]